MSPNFVLSNYIDRVMSSATCEKLKKDSYGGRIPACAGVVAFGKTLRECEDELRFTLEDWILVGLHLGHKLPVIDEIDINFKTERKQLETVYQLIR